MLNINNHAAHLKREILVRMAKMQLKNTLIEEIDSIPRQLAPDGSSSIRCCIHHDREIIRKRVIARLGFSLETAHEHKSLAFYAAEALKRKEPTWPILTVLDDACNACVRTQYLVTDACQACLARPCKINCPKNAIEITNGRAHISKSLCINCGICLQNCPFHAIIKIPVPCEEACPVGAITKDENGKEVIDYNKCIFCGKCMSNCPFGAMMDKSQLVDVIAHIMLGKKNIHALYAPSIAAQFRAVPGQLETALQKCGFDRVWEVAVGADLTADKEAVEFEERMKAGDRLMTTSCCPAYVRAVKKHVPALLKCVSETKTPMHYTARLAKKADPDCVTVFVGPCLAKRREAMDDDEVDYVLSIEEVGAFLIAKGIDIGKQEPTPENIIPTASGRNFAITGGVANAVKVRLKDNSILRAAVVNGLNKKGMAQLGIYGKMNEGSIEYKEDSPNLIEVMACEGGCIGGPSVVTNSKIAAMQLKKYVASGASDIS
ncbi:MAG TPA: monomeric [FeFe] hydrogenase [Treponemataceae bacterium]|nr:monomeric [FeFe] hydrogenase [Treponemataceae bacterium]